MIALLLGVPFACLLIAGILNPQRLLHPALVVYATAVFVYVIGYQQVPANVNDWFVEPQDYDYLMGFICACCLSFHAGTFVFAGAARRVRNADMDISRKFVIGLFLVTFIGKAVFIALSGGPIAFFSQTHGQAGAWDTSAYLYRLQDFVFTLLLFVLARRVLLRNTGITEALILVFCIASILFESFVFGNRGDTIRLALIAIVCGVALRGVIVSRFTAAAIGAIALTAVVLYPFLRPYLYLGAEGDLSEAFVEASSAIVAESGENGRIARPESTGSAVYYGVAVVASARADRDYDYGLGWAANAIAIIPRQLWPDKHIWFAERFLSPKVAAESAVGWEVAQGASPGGFSDSFLRFGWLALLFWFAIGIWGGHGYRQLSARRSITSIGYFVAYLIALIYLTTQDFAGAFSNYLYFVAPLWAITISRKLRMRSKAGQTAPVLS